MKSFDLYHHKFKINIRFSDLDAMQHVNNAKYLTYLEEARIDYLNKLHLDKTGSNYTVIVARIEIDYLLPLLLGDEVEILTRCSNIGNKSLTFEHLIIKNINGKSTAACKAVTKLVSFDSSEGKSVSVPEQVRMAIKKMEENG